MGEVWLVLFIMNLSLLLVHEMDAVRNHEWRMFIVLKDMADDKACLIFQLLHLPLYVAVLLLMMSPAQQILFYILDIFLIFHTAIHFGFRHHKNNALTSAFSKILIYGMGVISVVHLAGIYLTV